MDDSMKDLGLKASLISI